MTRTWPGTARTSDSLCSAQHTGKVAGGSRRTSLYLQTIGRIISRTRASSEGLPHTVFKSLIAITAYLGITHKYWTIRLIHTSRTAKCSAPFGRESKNCAPAPLVSDVNVRGKIARNDPLVCNSVLITFAGWSAVCATLSEMRRTTKSQTKHRTGAREGRKGNQRRPKSLCGVLTSICKRN